MRIAALLSTLLLAAPVASAQMLTDTEQRAAYCIGVLKYHMEENLGGTRDAIDRLVCGSWQEWRFHTREACADAAAQEVLAADRAKLSRYGDYLKLQLGQHILSGDKLDGTAASIALMVGKGRSDAHALASSTRAQHPAVDSCVAACVNQDVESCVVDCIAQRDPAAASVLRCMLLPDGLRY
jgi:hypothetical protein